MVRRQKKSKSSDRAFSLVGLKDRKRKKAREIRRDFLVLFKILAVVGVLGAIAVGLGLLRFYAQRENEIGSKTGIVKLVNAPAWVNEALKNKIYSAATAHGEDLTIDEKAAESVQHNITELVPWIHDVNVQVTHDSLLVSGIWRKPLGLVEAASKYYVDADLVVLDYVPIASLPVVRITGLAPEAVPPPGSVWQKDDLAAAVEILARLDKMDGRVTPEKPLLLEIENIDLANFDGRSDPGKPHIELYAKDGTKIVWGAEYGKWAEHLEATDVEKIGRLYTFYTAHGTILHVAQYINLCDPQDYVPQPVDGY
jgi:hypothetical protein